MLEEQMQALRDLPARVSGVESQILQLREEMQVGFSAIRTEFRGELHELGAALRAEMHGMRDDLRAEMHEMRDDLRAEMHGMRDDLRAEMQGMRNELRADIVTANLETQNLMRVLHEQAKADMRVMSEGRGRARKNR
jgi:hypothetical protein